MNSGTLNERHRGEQPPAMLPQVGRVAYGAVCAALFLSRLCKAERATH